VTPELILKIKEIKKAYDKKFEELEESKDSQEKIKIDMKKGLEILKADRISAETRKANEKRDKKIKGLQITLDEKLRELEMMEGYGPITRLFNMAYKRKLKRKVSELKEKISKLGR
jgi:hypothetical protein